MTYREADNNYDMLKGCVNRIFVTDDKEELISLYAGALHYLSLIFLYGKERFSERSENSCTGCEHYDKDLGCLHGGQCAYEE